MATTGGGADNRPSASIKKMKKDFLKGFTMQEFSSLNIEDRAHYYMLLVCPVVVETATHRCVKDVVAFAYLTKLYITKKSASNTMLALPEKISKLERTVGLIKLQGVFTGAEIRKKIGGMKGKVFGRIVGEKKGFSIGRILLEAIFLSKEGK